MPSSNVLDFDATGSTGKANIPIVAWNEEISSESDNSEVDDVDLNQDFDDLSEYHSSHSEVSFESLNEHLHQSLAPRIAPVAQPQTSSKNFQDKSSSSLSPHSLSSSSSSSST
jgi:hypothetical protein